MIHKGIHLPDGDHHMIKMLDKYPEVDGKGQYQYNKYQAALKYVKNFRTAIDIGGHVGIWAMRMCKDFEVVHSFEPVPLFRELYLKNVEGNYVLHPVACGEKEERVSIEFKPGWSGTSWVVEGDDFEVIRIDDLGLEDVDFIKADCEGYELFALRGAQRTILKCKPVIIVEQKPGNGERYGLERTEAVTYLKSLGMHLKHEIIGDYIMSWD